jgi:hypothetical protein
MKTIQLELSERIYDHVMSILELFTENECHIVENINTQQQALKEALEAAVATNPFADIADPAAWQREIRQDRPLPGRDT